MPVTESAVASLSLSLIWMLRGLFSASGWRCDVKCSVAAGRENEGENERLQMVVEMKAFKPLGVCRMVRCLRECFFSCLLHVGKSHRIPAMTTIMVFPNVCFLSFFLFQTPLRRWIYRLFLRAPLGKVIMWHWNARRTETLLPPASTSTLRWEIASRVHSNHASLSSRVLLSALYPSLQVNYTISFSLLPFSGQEGHGDWQGCLHSDWRYPRRQWLVQVLPSWQRCNGVHSDRHSELWVGKRCFLLLYLSPISP